MKSSHCLVLAGVSFIVGIWVSAMAWVPLWACLSVLAVVLVFSLGMCREDTMPQDRDLKYRLLHPMFADVEARVGRGIPEPIRQLYCDQDSILLTDFYILDPVEERAAWLITAFLPVDTETVGTRWPQM